MKSYTNFRTDTIMLIVRKCSLFFRNCANTINHIKTVFEIFHVYLSFVESDLNAIYCLKINSLGPSPVATGEYKRIAQGNSLQTGTGRKCFHIVLTALNSSSLALISIDLGSDLYLYILGFRFTDAMIKPN